MIIYVKIYALFDFILGAPPPKKPYHHKKTLHWRFLSFRLKKEDVAMGEKWMINLRYAYNWPKINLLWWTLLGILGFLFEAAF